MKKSTRKLSLPAAAGMGYGVCILMTVMLIGLAAFLIGREMLPESRMEELAMGVLLLAAAAGAGSGCRIAGEQKLVIGMTIGCAYFLTLLLCGAFAYHGNYQGVWVKAGTIFAGTGAAVLLTPISSKSKMKKRRKMRYR